jgi:hypothetical protein
MRKLRLGAVALAAFSIVSAHSGAATAKGDADKPTVVVIDPSGNDVDATIANEVEIKNDSGALSVTVGNGPGQAVPVDDGAATRIPFTFFLSDIGPPGETSFSYVVRRVPVGELLVIEEVSARVRIFGDGYLESFFVAASNAEGDQWRFYPEFWERESPPDERRYFTNESVRYYAEEETIPAIAFSVDGPVPASLTVAFDLTVSGYTIPMDEPSLSP